MTGHLKLGSALAAALLLTACASTDDRYTFGIDDDDQYEAVVTSTTVATPNTAVASRVIRTDDSIYDGRNYLTSYSTVYGQIDTLGLGTVLDGDDDYTVFAPSNTAFTYVDVSGVSEADRKNLILGHTLEGSIDSVTLANLIDTNGGVYTATTLNGSDLTFMRMGDAIKVADANGYTFTIDAADNQFANGYVHGIDGVLGYTY